MRALFRRQEGATVAELALILPLVLLFLFGIMEGARVLSAWMVLTNETREAARYGVAGMNDYVLYNGASTSSWLTNVQSHAENRIDGILDSAYLTVPAPVLTLPTGSTPGSLSVSASYAVHMVTPLMNSVMGTVTVSATSVMRTE